MKSFLLSVLYFLLTTLPGQAGPKAIASPVSGVYDLREANMDEGFMVNLNGEWEFFWEQFLMPEEYVTQKGKGLLVNVPSYWSSYILDGEELPGMGYGTYALTILLPENRPRVICMDIPVFDVAFNFYLNDRLVHQSGTLGTSREEEIPFYKPGSMCMEIQSDTLELLVQVSNFHHRRGGFWQGVTIGNSSRVLMKTEHRKIYSYSTIGVLFLFTLFFLLFWLISRKDLSMILFALSTLGILIRSVNTGEFFSNYFIDTPWTWQIRMEYVGTYLAMAVGMIFLHNIMPRKYMKPIIISNSLLMLLLIILVFALPPWLFTYTILVFQPLILVFLVHYLVLSFTGLLKGRLSDVVFFLSLGIFMFALINDILLANTAGSASSRYLSQISFQVFILAMAILIIVKWVKIDRLREQLEGSLRFKNRVLSVIAHDLKNPVASVAQFSDLLATKPELSAKPEIMKALHESSQAAVSLLDNLLFWGRSQSDDLSVHPTHFEMGVLIREVNSLLGHMALQKKIELNIQMTSHTKVYADKAQVNIIVRNLISNAIKFTPSGGKVEVKSIVEGDVVRITVSDTGIGIKTDLLEQFRDEGRLGTSPGTDREIGTGLGLQLVSELVSLNKGILDVKSIPRKGSTFSFTLPSGNNNAYDTEKNEST